MSMYSLTIIRENMDLQEILTNHMLWLADSSTGCKADLQGADLRVADLQGADLRWADLRVADLRWANMQGANLQVADLRGANLRWANMQGANMQGAKILIGNKEIIL